MAKGSCAVANMCKPKPACVRLYQAKLAQLTCATYVIFGDPETAFQTQSVASKFLKTESFI